MGNDQLFQQHAELLVASTLSRSGIPFDFATDHPDLLLDQGSCGIEVGTRTVEWQSILEKLIEAAIADRPGLRVTLDFSYPVLKMKEDRRLQVRDLVLGLPLTGGEDRCEWDGVVLAARQEISADATKSSEVIVRFNGGLGCDLSCHVDEVEREYDGVIEAKVKQGARVPKILCRVVVPEAHPEEAISR
jgi:hypothetical protein